MELLQSDDENLVVRMEKADFANIVSAFMAIKQDFSSVDPAISEMSKDQVNSLLERLVFTMRQLPAVAKSRRSLDSAIP